MDRLKIMTLTKAAHAKQFLAPIALTSMVSLLAACGGESASVNENGKGPTTASNGCFNSDAKCQTFVLDYPVRGMNFDCSSNKNNHFITVQERDDNLGLEQNVVSGGCPLKDKVQFYVQGPDTDKKIQLGEVDLGKLNSLYVAAQPTQIGLLDIAVAMTGKAAEKADMSDETFKVLVGLIHVFQTVGVEQKTNAAGEIQPVELTNQLKNDLKNIDATVGVADFKDGSYVQKLTPWIKLDNVTQNTAEQVAKDLLNLSLTRNYKADFMALKNDEVDLGGFNGKSLSGDLSIASLFGLITRQGYHLGYGIQWAGKPVFEGNPNFDGMERLLLLSQISPSKLNIKTGTDWISPLQNKIVAPLLLSNPKVTTPSEMKINQGTFFNGNSIPGNEFMYRRITGEKAGPSSTSVYGAWEQELGNQRFTGHLDLYKTNPATYLDKRVFLTERNVDTGQKYVFPLYMNLTFEYRKVENGVDKPANIPNEKISIVIDEFGDIRTNRSSNSLVSEQCPTIDQDSYVDALGVEQFRIGTTGAANYSAADKSITLRMILANPVFKNLDGALIGLNDNLMWSFNNQNGGTAQFYESGGVRINLHNMISGQDASQGINITGWNSSGATPAQWGNMLAIMQHVYNENNKDKKNVTQEQLDLAKRGGGRITVELPKCYEMKTKL